MNYGIDGYICFEENTIYTKTTQSLPFKGLGHGFFTSMQKFASNVAQIDAENDEIDNYSSLLKRCVRTAIEMRVRKITDKSLICICSHNHLNSCVPLIAAQFLGAKVCSLDPILSEAAMSHLIKQTMPDMFFVSPECVETIESVLKNSNCMGDIVVFEQTSFDEFLRKKDDEEEFKPVEVENLKATAFVLFSSGTTGLPKGICLNHLSFLRQIDLVDNSTTLTFATFYWVTAIIFLSLAIFNGTCRLIVKKFDQFKCWEHLAKYKVTVTFLSTTLASEFSLAGEISRKDLPNLKIFSMGGAPVSATLVQKLRNQLPHTTVVPGYGQTEGAKFLTWFNPKSKKDVELMLKNPTSCGRPVAGISYKIVDTETNEIVGCNKTGELRFKSGCMMNGYYNMDSSGAWDEDGWMRTGDIAYYDEDFCFFLVGRMKEMLKYKCWHVTPATIENVLFTHPAVRVCVVVGLPHGDDGDYPVALVVLKAEWENRIETSDILQYSNERLDDTHQLRGGLKIVKRLLYTATGKIRRCEIRDILVKGQIEKLM